MMSKVGSGEESGALPGIFWAGLLCGVMDITAAFATWASRGVTPVDILHVIASGLIGEKSFDGGMRTAGLGLALHFLIAYSAAAVFYAASRRFHFLTRRPIISGVAYGVAVYAVMYWVVIPLSNYHPAASSLFNTTVAIVTHVICVGLPISLAVRRFSH
jgi:hypothetical protein